MITIKKATTIPARLSSTATDKLISKLSDVVDAVEHRTTYEYLRGEELDMVNHFISVVMTELETRPDVPSKWLPVVEAIESKPPTEEFNHDDYKLIYSVI